jgi:hypothetical protein
VAILSGLSGLGIKQMEQKRKKEILDLDFRHYIYTTFAETSFPPTTSEVADQFKISIAMVHRPT